MDPSIECSLDRLLLTSGQTGHWEAPVEDFDIPQSKMAESAQRVVDRAIEEARRREHALLTNEHIFLAFAQVEWDMFAEVMRDLELNPHTILQAIEEHLHMMPTVAGRELRVVAGDQARLQAGAASRQPRRPPDDRGGRSVLGDVRGDAGRSRLDHPRATASSRRCWCRA